MDEQRWKEWQERERDPNAMGSRAWHRRELEAADQMVGMAMGIIAIAFVLGIVVFFLLAF